MRFLFSLIVMTISFNLFALPTKVEFAGYKFLTKTKVGGTFTDVKVTHDEKATNLESLLRSLKVQIATSSLETNNKSRNKNILTTLFATKGSKYVVAKTKTVNLKNDYIVMSVTIEKITKDIVFQYTKIKDSLIFSSSIDLVAFGLGQQFADFAAKCAGFHTDENGIHKTWSSIDVIVKSNITGMNITK